MSSSTYSTPPFTLVSVRQTAINCFRVRFNAPPLAVSSAGSTDALNIHNYSIIGPTPLTIDRVIATFGDSLSVDVFLNENIGLGTYSFHVSNVVGA